MKIRYVPEIPYGNQIFAQGFRLTVNDPAIRQKIIALLTKNKCLFFTEEVINPIYHYPFMAHDIWRNDPGAIHFAAYGSRFTTGYFSVLREIIDELALIPTPADGRTLGLLLHGGINLPYHAAKGCYATLRMFAAPIAVTAGFIAAVALTDYIEQTAKRP